MNLLAVRQDSCGDVLLAGPALRAMRAGAERLTLLCAPAGAAAARTLPGVDAVLVAPAPWIAADAPAVDPAQIAALTAELRARRFDRALIFTSFHQSPLPMALVLRLAGIPWLGAISVDYPGSLLDLRHRTGDDVHEVERALGLARAAGFPLPPHDDRGLQMRVEPVAVGGPESYVVVHPGATVPARAWSPARNRALVAALHARGTRVVVTGGAAERELCAYVAGDDAEDRSGGTTFAQLAGTIAAARAIVVGNTGAAHVAAAVGTPTVSLFPPTIPASRFRPWRVPHALLGDQSVPCAGCRAKICPLPAQICLDAVSVEDVLAALDGLLAVPAPMLSR